MFHFVVVEIVIPGQNFFREEAQLGNVPLAVAELINETALGLLPRDREAPVETLIGEMDLQVPAQNYKKLTYAVDQLFGKLLLAFQLETQTLALGDVGDGKQNRVGGVLLVHPVAVEQHDALTDGLEFVLHPVVNNRAVLAQHLLEQAPQPGYVPLSVAEIVDEAAQGFCGFNLKLLQECPVRSLHAQSSIEDQQRLGNCFDDCFDERTHLANYRA